jgi:AcrR family transcriptional regulator
MYLFEEIMDSYTEGIENILKKATSGMEAIEELIRFHFRFGEQRSQELKVVMRDFPSNLIEFGSPFREKVTERLSRIMDVTKECIERGLKDGSIRDLSPEETSFIIQGILIGVSRLKLMGPLRVPNLSSQVIDLCRRGLAKPN